MACVASSLVGRVASASCRRIVVAGRSCVVVAAWRVWRYVWRRQRRVASRARRVASSASARRQRGAACGVARVASASRRVASLRCVASRGARGVASLVGVAWRA
ncbi:hypothetical protein ACXZ9C_11510 [Streptococcus agalactiae]